MTNGRQFKHYVWIVNTLRHRGRLTLSELNDLWVSDEVADGNPLPRSSFNKYRDAIHDMLAERLAIAQKWKLFEQLWQRNNMRGDYNKALEQKKSLDFQEKLKYILV